MPTTFDEDERTDKAPSEDLGFKAANDLFSQEKGFEEQLNKKYGRKTQDNEDNESDASSSSNFLKNDDDSDDKNKNRDKVKDQEESEEPPEGSGRLNASKTRFGGKLNKKMIPGGIVALLIALIGGGSVIIIPSSLLVMMERVFTNNGTHDTRANSMMGRARMSGLFSPVRDAACSSSKIVCKVTSMSKREAEVWKKQDGVRIEEKRNAFGRTVIAAMYIDQPNGKPPLKIENSREFNNAVKTNEHFRRINNTVLSKAGYFIGPDSKKRSIDKKWKLSMSSAFSKLKPGLSREERAKALSADADKATGSPTEGDQATKNKSRVEKIKQKVTSVHTRLKTSITGKIAGGVGNVTGWGSTACAIYSVHNATLTAIKIGYYAELIKYFMPVAVAMGQAVEGDIDPELMEYLGDRLTWYQPEATADTPEKKAKVNLTATDSQGFQAALYGDFSKLKEFTLQYAPWWALSAATTSGMLASFEQAIGGKDNLHKACYGAKYLSYIGDRTPTALAVLAACKLTDIFADDACSDVIMAAVQFIVDEAVEDVYERMEETALDSSLKGVDFGNALAAGFGLYLMEKGRGSGLKPATSMAAVTASALATEEAYQLDELAKKDDAKANPFDLTNSYSFANNVVGTLVPYKDSETTGFSIANNYMSVLKNTFTFNNTKAVATGYHQPIEGLKNEKSLRSMTKEGNADGKGRTCQDYDMNNMGYLCDMYGRSIDVVDPETMKWAEQMFEGDISPWEQTVEYMQNNNYIEKDGSGKPVGYDQYNDSPDPESYEEKKYDNEYLMWKAYCTNDRVYPLGTSTVAIDSEEYDFESMGWYTGAKCGGNDAGGEPIQDASFKEKLNRFFFFYNMAEVQIGGADANQKVWEDEPVPEASALASTATVNTGEWVVPVPGPCGDGFGARSGGHKGIDIAAPAGTPILAPTSMRITFNGVSRDGSTGNALTATATDGSDISFTFMHMIAPSPLAVGQEVSKGTEIGRVGSTGDSSGPHLHLDTFPPGVNGLSYSGQVDPVSTFASHGVSIKCAA